MSGEVLLWVASTLQLNFYSAADWVTWIGPWVVVVAVLSVTSLWALNLSRAITVRLRKRQALGIGLLALSLAWFTANFIFDHPETLGTTAGDSYFLLQFFLPFLTFFYWIDASVVASRRADPLLRDTFHWRRIRLWVWAYLIAMTCLYVVTAIILSDLLGVTGSPSTAIVTVAIFSVIGLPFVAGPILLPVVSRRSADAALRGHLRWFAYFTAFLGLGLVGIIAIPLWQGLWAVAGYCLYRSVKSLVIVDTLPSTTIIAAGPTGTEGSARTVALSRRLLARSCVPG